MDSLLLNLRQFLMFPVFPVMVLLGACTTTNNGIGQDTCAKVVNGETKSEIVKRKSYASDFSRMIEERLSLPQKFVGKKLSTEITFYVGSDGMANGVKIKKSSGDHEFDELAIKVLHAAEPLPCPPEALVNQEISLKLQTRN